ncbi:hypothetical protein F9802_14945 [Bacillus aerolatus]|uniref:Cytochrome-c oxidase n=1 Tax=Bacillus aerolatus TaxID=2653354 RepID=A0A6I1FN56_9BACI|nr:hypothetical protein [Bacillus aerolatus]KAB7705393.1 hypothetical protein F9802_14945 [Bacillus aerolatus]
MSYHVLLVRTAAIFGFIGAMMGSHMAGAGSYAFRPIHAHILVVGWLSLFAFAAFYRMYSVPRKSKLAGAHVWSAIIGTIGLTSGMWLYTVKPFDLPETFTTVFYIVGGTILLISFLLFVFVAFKYGKDNSKTPEM